MAHGKTVGQQIDETLGKFDQDRNRLEAQLHRLQEDRDKINQAITTTETGLITLEREKRKAVEVILVEAGIAPVAGSGQSAAARVEAGARRLDAMGKQLESINS